VRAPALLQTPGSCYRVDVHVLLCHGVWVQLQLQDFSARADPDATDILQLLMQRDQPSVTQYVHIEYVHM